MGGKSDGNDLHLLIISRRPWLSEDTTTLVALNKQMTRYLTMGKRNKGPSEPTQSTCLPTRSFFFVPPGNSGRHRWIVFFFRSTIQSLGRWGSDSISCLWRPRKNPNDHIHNQKQNRRLEWWHRLVSFIAIEHLLVFFSPLTRRSLKGNILFDMRRLCKKKRTKKKKSHDEIRHKKSSLSSWKKQKWNNNSQ